MIRLRRATDERECMSISKRLPLAVGGLGAAVVLGLGASYALGGQQDATDQVRLGLHGGKAKNVIFLLGDGMGTQEITAARYYQYGAAGRMNVDKLLFTGFDTTWSVKSGAAPPYLPDYDPDSASTGTMWATGQKTIDERISQGPSSSDTTPGKNFKTVLEIAQRLGKKTGNVSTAEITDATPAVLDSHISLRGCQGPNDTRTTCPTETKAAGGLGSIAEQTVDHGVDVVLGGGANRFKQPLDAGGTTTVVDYAQEQGYQYVSDATGLAGVDKRKPVLGLFTGGNMTTEWTGPIATLGDGSPAQKCVTTNRPANEPSLAAMTSKALTLLQGDRDGFFLQVEGASIDKQDHAANACGQIGETIAFDDAIGVAMQYQRSHPDTLVVVTADHAHTSQIVAEDSTGNGSPTGYSNNLTTKDGQTLRLTYGTAGGTARPAAPPSQQHTGSVVPVWASGPGAAAVLGTNDHTDLFEVLGGKGKHHGGWPR
jgi:alkaline phosphatase